MTTRRESDQPLENRLEGTIDGALHLLDRQLLDRDGAFLGKVDDIELTEDGDRLVVTGILTGPAALLDRLGGRLGRTLVERWGQMRVSEPHRTRPWRIDIADVDRLDSAVHLRVRRDGVLRRDRERRRFGRLTGMDALAPDGRRLGRVLDCRFAADEGRLVMVALLVGRGRPGSLLGYDRRPSQGPAVVRGLVRWLHRHTVIVDAGDARVDWADRTVRLASTPTDRPDHPFEQG